MYVQYIRSRIKLNDVIVMRKLYYNTFYYDVQAHTHAMAISFNRYILTMDEWISI